jgi:hypothetical protein
LAQCDNAPHEESGKWVAHALKSRWMLEGAAGLRAGHSILLHAGFG